MCRCAEQPILLQDKVLRIIVHTQCDDGIPDALALGMVKADWIAVFTVCLADNRQRRIKPQGKILTGKNLCKIGKYLPPRANQPVAGVTKINPITNIRRGIRQGQFGCYRSWPVSSYFEKGGSVFITRADHFKESEPAVQIGPVSYTHLRAHETVLD